MCCFRIRGLLFDLEYDIIFANKQTISTYKYDKTGKGIKMIFSNRIIKYSTVVFTAAVMIFLAGCNDVKHDKEFKSESPSGEKTVTVKVDHVSRPDVFYNDECIFEYSGSGFSETVYWNVEWISENEIRLYLDSYEGEDCSIDIPDE